MTSSATTSGTFARHRTMAQVATDELRRRILDGAIGAGEPLRQSALAEELGISRIPLREALLQLEAEGLVRINAHKGAVVSDLTTEEVDELFDLRAAIEPMLLRRSAPRLTPEDFRMMHLLLDEYSRELQVENVKRWGELNTAFHRLLYRHAERPRSNTLVFNLLQECDRHTRLHLSMAGARDRAEEEHRALLALCEQRQFAAAARLLKAHILNVATSLNALLRARDAAAP